jgi:hypothetical protein
MAKGEKLNKAEEWMDRAITQEEKGNQSMMTRCIDKAIELEKEGLAAGESY